jgi:hypothetical protein
MRILVNIVAGFFRFWYDFIVGDCWQIAAGVAVILLAGALAVQSQALSGSIIPFVVAGAVMFLVLLTVVSEFRRKTAQM